MSPRIRTGMQTTRARSLRAVTGTSPSTTLPRALVVADFPAQQVLKMEGLASGRPYLANHHEAPLLSGNRDKKQQVRERQVREDPP